MNTIKLDGNLDYHSLVFNGTNGSKINGISQKFSLSDKVKFSDYKKLLSY